MKSELIRHKEVVERAGMTLAEIKRNIGKGEWPLPHSVIERTYRWKRHVIEHWLARGEWPQGTEFRKLRSGRAADDETVGGPSEASALRA
jgi:predicted DNA-binding transcriptional regulator AlpA